MWCSSLRVLLAAAGHWGGCTLRCPRRAPLVFGDIGPRAFSAREELEGGRRYWDGEVEEERIIQCNSGANTHLREWSARQKSTQNAIQQEHYIRRTSLTNSHRCAIIIYMDLSCPFLILSPPSPFLAHCSPLCLLLLPGSSVSTSPSDEQRSDDRTAATRTRAGLASTHPPTPAQPTPHTHTHASRVLTPLPTHITAMSSPAQDMGPKVRTTDTAFVSCRLA